ncbi:hypothetical protein FKM82_013761 [Ascaphus truei]
MELSELIQTSKVEKVCVSCPLMPPLTGTLCVSSHHLLLSAPPMREVGQEGGAAVQEGGFSEIWLLHRVVDAVEKSVQNMGRYQRRESSGQESESRSGSGTVTLRCKDLRVVQLEIPGMEETLNVARSVQVSNNANRGGHPFLLRCAHSAWSRDRPRHEAPLFLLFLDCCWQIGHQFPRSLEFNERFLCRLAAHAYSSECLYEVREMTHSLWDFLNDPTECQQLLNPLYEPNSLVIWPSVEPQSLQLWEGFFLRYLRPPEHTELAWERMVELAGRVNLSDSQTHQS